MTQAIWRQERAQAGATPLPFGDLAELGLIPGRDWLSPKECAERLGITADAFRLSYCNPDRPRVVFWERRGRRGGRRILVQPGSFEQLIRDGLALPA